MGFRRNKARDIHPASKIMAYSLSQYDTENPDNTQTHDSPKMWNGAPSSPAVPISAAMFNHYTFQFPKEDPNFLSEAFVHQNSGMSTYQQHFPRAGTDGLTFEGFDPGLVDTKNKAQMQGKKGFSFGQDDAMWFETQIFLSPIDAGGVLKAQTGVEMWVGLATELESGENIFNLDRTADPAPGDGDIDNGIGFRIEPYQGGLYPSVIGSGTDEVWQSLINDGIFTSNDEAANLARYSIYGDSVTGVETTMQGQWIILQVQYHPNVGEYGRLKLFVSGETDTYGAGTPMEVDVTEAMSTVFGEELFLTVGVTTGPDVYHGGNSGPDAAFLTDVVNVSVKTATVVTENITPPADEDDK